MLHAQEEEVVLHTPTGDLYGTLSVPEQKSGIPVALIIAGSGPTDRNGNNPLAGSNNSLKMLAELFVENGIAALRFDKRGIAASNKSLSSEADVTFDTYIADAKAWVEWLAKAPRFSGVIIAGHSEGALIGMLAAADNREVKGYISIAGSGENLATTLRRQLAPQPEPIRAEAERIIDQLEAGEKVKEVSPLMQSLFRPSVQPFLISLFKYHPAKEIAKLTVPVLILQGTTDIQIKKEDAILLSKGNPKAQLVIVENMNHVLKECSTTDIHTQIATYGNPELPLAPKFKERLSDFLLKLK
ncbi:MAG: alpha/beta hydrolase [Culturomica sp.]|nr:alpha/beta hydrolase [Culturomica sp.]